MIELINATNAQLKITTLAHALLVALIVDPLQAATQPMDFLSSTKAYHSTQLPLFQTIIESAMTSSPKEKAAQKADNALSNISPILDQIQPTLPSLTIGSTLRMESHGHLLALQELLPHREPRHLQQPHPSRPHHHLLQQRALPLPIQHQVVSRLNL